MQTDKTMRVCMMRQGATKANIPAAIVINEKRHAVTCVGDRSLNNKDLTSVTIPNSITTLEGSPFYDCDNLTSIHIPKSVTSMTYRVLFNCESLEEVTVDADNPVYDSRNHCNAIIETATKTLIAGTVATRIPNDVERIGPCAFDSLKVLYTIAIPASVTNIGDKAFRNCKQLEEITCLGNVPPTLGDNVFESVTKRCTVYVPKGSKGAYTNTWPFNYDSIVVFDEANMPYDQYTLNATVTAGEYIYRITSNNTVEVAALYDTSYYMPRIFIEENIFLYGKKYTVTGVGKAAFYNNEKIYAVHNHAPLIYIGSRAFAGCRNLTEFYCPETLEEIGESTFEGCAALHSVYGANVKTIQDAAFLNCENLGFMNGLLATPPTLGGSRVFEGCSEELFFVIPEGSLPAYLEAWPFTEDHYSYF